MTETGHFRQYRDMRLGQAKLDLIGMANDIIAEYTQAGHSLTLRQLYYQFVARDILPNRVESYNRLGAAVSDGRLAGLVSWTAIEDRGRNLRGLGYHDSPEDGIKALASSYRRDLWAGQQWRPEVWIEKEALVGVIAGVCNRLRVDFFACKGYNSQSEQWRAGQRFADRIRRGQRPIVFHLGDHDPSGIDMTRDNQERLSMFAGTQVIVQRLALNMPQIEELRPPPNPAKVTDSRFEDYAATYGTRSSWELDALDPRTIESLIESALLRIRDPEIYDQELRREAEEIRYLRTLTGDDDD